MHNDLAHGGQQPKHISDIATAAAVASEQRRTSGRSSRSSHEPQYFEGRFDGPKAVLAGQK